MNQQLPTVKLSELAEIFSGFAFKSKDLQNQGIPLIKIKNVNHKVVSKDCEQFFPSDLVTNRLNKYFLQEKDVLVAMTGQGSLGRIGRMQSKRDKYLVNQRVGIVRAHDLSNADYLFSVLALDTYEEQLFTIGLGAGQPNVSAQDIGNLEIPWPSTAQRKFIGNVRCTYDELIENNNRRIQILETIAQNLYQEWFINFRFPNHQQTQWQETPQGKIPLGWEVKKLAEIATVNPESITKKSAPEEIHYIDISSVNTGSVEEIRTLNFAEAPSRARRKVSHADIIWATVRPNRKQFAYLANPIENTIVSTGFAVLRAEKVPASFLYQATTTDSFTAYLVNHATGAAYPAVNASVFESAEVLVPDKYLLEKFDQLSATTMKQIEVLKKKNKNLKQQRDMLLPKLISIGV